MRKKTKSNFLPGSQAILWATLSGLLCLAVANLKPRRQKPGAVRCVACLESMVHALPQEWSSRRCPVKTSRTVSGEWAWQLWGSHECENCVENWSITKIWGAQLSSLTYGSQGNKATTPLGSWVIRSFQTHLGDIVCLWSAPALLDMMRRVFIFWGASSKHPANAH